MVRALMRYFSYAFHGLLTIFLVAVSGLALATSPSSLRLEVLPWTGSTLTYALFFGSLFGLLTVILALRGTLRALFLIWALAVAVFLVKGYVFSGYHFARSGLSFAGGMILASWIALAGAWFQMRPARKSKY